MHGSRKGTRPARMVALLLTVLLALMWLQRDALIAFIHQRNTISATVLDVPRPLVNIHLRDGHGKPVTEETLKGQWTWMFFGFSRCHEICPTHLRMLAQAYQQLSDQKVHPLPQVVMVSLDSKHDDPRHLASYVHSFHSAFSGWTGTAHEVGALAHQSYLSFSRSHSGEIEHSNSVLLINPEGCVYAIYTQPSARVLVEDYRSLKRLS